MTQDNGCSIAIIAMDCKIPQANSPDELWSLLVNEKCTLTNLSDAELLQSGVPESLFSKSSYVKKAGTLDDVSSFDSGYFDISSKEADILDVQQRLLLQSALILLNRANINPDTYSKRIGVFAGSGFSSYLFGILERADLLDSLGEMVIRHGNDKDFLAPRISYKLNLRGPSVNVQTACSTGLVAVHSACQSLLLNECDSAIAGAVWIKVPQENGYLHQKDGILSPDGICRPFDASANGTIFANGLGLVMLKRLGDAIEDGDEVIAVIRGSSVNNDGSAKVGFTAPSAVGQELALREAIEVAGIDPQDIQYIETHGTGTALGDPIELAAIQAAYGESGQKCGLGSLKSNFGHFNIAAGIIGLIKAALILKYKKIPATINIKALNPNLNLDPQLGHSRFYVTTQTAALDTTQPQIIGVSSFGMGGTNGHVILENFEGALVTNSAGDDHQQPSIYTISAKSERALDLLVDEHKNFFASEDCENFGDAAYTSYTCRRTHKNRVALTAKNKAEALAILNSKTYSRHLGQDKNKIAFVFSGQGTQNVNMGLELAKSSPDFRNNLNSILEIFHQDQMLDLKSYLWNTEKEADISLTNITQPLLFAVEYALAKTLMEKGVMPNYVFGHSLGEIVAATISGVFQLRDAISIVSKRSYLMSQCAQGAMIAVKDLGRISKFLSSERISVATYNSPNQFVLSGDFAPILALEEFLSSENIKYQKLATSHAFHSEMMQAASIEFHEFMKGIQFGDAQIPIVSNITGNVLTTYEYKNPFYWADHIMKPVQFSRSICTLHELGVLHFIEIGHGQSMSNLIRSNLSSRVAAPISADPISKTDQGHGSGELNLLPALGFPGEEVQSFMNVLAHYWTLGFDIPLNEFIRGHKKTSIPVYQFDCKRHWVDPVIGFQSRGATKKIQFSSPALAIREISEPGISRGGLELVSETKPLMKSESNSDLMIQKSEENPVESIVLEIYANYIGSGPIDRSLSFFDLGGNSLLAIQMISKLRETFNIDIPMRGFYENSSVQAISMTIANMMLGKAENE